MGLSAEIREVEILLEGGGGVLGVDIDIGVDPLVSRGSAVSRACDIRHGHTQVFDGFRDIDHIEGQGDALGLDDDFVPGKRIGDGAVFAGQLPTRRESRRGHLQCGQVVVVPGVGNGQQVEKHYCCYSNLAVHIFRYLTKMHMLNVFIHSLPSHLLAPALLTTILTDRSKTFPKTLTPPLHIYPTVATKVLI